MPYPFDKIEKKWRKRWEKEKLYKTDFSRIKDKCYTLVMFCYPSSDKLHVGHWFNYGPTDTWARFKRMNGFNVFEPMGFDSFGLPAENYAIKTGGHPHDITEKNIEVIREQIKSIGGLYDWDQEVITSHPEYYKWTQWMFLQLFKKGLAYRANAYVNWCPSCNTVLANEQVIGDGVCERCETRVIKKNLTQWFFKITEYADRLLENLEDLDWPEKTKIMQRNWIGKSYGAEVQFRVDDSSNKVIKVFTTRPDTLFGVTYMVLAPENPLVDEITTPLQKKEVKSYVEASIRQSEVERTSLGKEKTGVFTGAFAVNPVNDEKIPIWIADYVLLSYGTGAVMAVPGHDERDFEFAMQYELPIRKVIHQPGTEVNSPLMEAYVEEGFMLDSRQFSGLPSEEGRKKIVHWLEENGWGTSKINYRLRDWLVSRQRYWGAPIPIIHCDVCGEVPVPEDQLPVLLPYDVDFRPTGQSPLQYSDEFRKTKCPKCNKDAVREADTMDTFVDSSWYFLRYFTPNQADAPFDKELVNKWCPIDKYVGGAEHATLHLIYARFINMALYDQGLISFEEPFASLRHQGVIKGPDGQKMAKSRGNVVNPEEFIKKYGIDVFRCYLMFGFDYAEGGPWEDSGISSMERYLNRVWRLYKNILWIFEAQPKNGELGESERILNKVLHNSIKGATADIDRFHFNTAISRLMELTNELYRYTSEKPREEQNTQLLREVFEKLLLMLAPFAPHLAEELWEKTGHAFSIVDQEWPQLDPAVLADDQVNYVIQVNGKLRDKLEISRETPQKEIEQEALKAGKIVKYVEGKQVQKIIFIPNKLVNIVVR
jgi:leucyl-tRNA synthetase